MISDPTGNTWQRTEDGNFIVSSDGMSIQIYPDHTDEQLTDTVTFFRSEWAKPIKTDAERIAELEAQLAALLAKLQ